MARPLAQAECRTPDTRQHDEPAERDPVLDQFAMILAAAAIRLLRSPQQ